MKYFFLLSTGKIGRVATALFFAVMLWSSSKEAIAQNPDPGPVPEMTPPKPPAPVGSVADNKQVTDRTAPPTGSTSEKKSVMNDLESGHQSLKALDLATARLFYEQAFSKCDTAGIKGPLLAKIYMALGALYSGYLQQVPQGTEFMKMSLQIDPSSEPEASIVNTQVTTTLNMVKENLGIQAVKPELQKAASPPDATKKSGRTLDGFWIMKHKRVTRGKSMYPFGIHIETNKLVAVEGVRLFFRFPSDPNFQVMDMMRNGNLFGAVIDCNSIALLDPKAFYYYIEIIGGDGSIIAREGSRAEPVEMVLVPEDEFRGEQPILPGMAPQSKCDPNEATPCPPWNPHCKDTPCITEEDCSASQKCHEGFCADTGGKGFKKPIGIVISGGLGIGAGFATGTEAGIYDYNQDIDLDSGFSPSWMFTRFMAGYYILDNLLIGAFVRMQHIHRHQWGNNPPPEDPQNQYVSREAEYNMAVAGPALDDQGAPDKWYGPMWGPTIALFFWGDGKWMGPAQVLAPDGTLAAKQGLRAYARFEFNVYGALYHEVSLSGKKPDYALEDPSEDRDVKVYRQHLSGLEGLGLGAGFLYGVHKHLDIGLELMYDFMFPDIGHNFDLQAQLQFHF